MVNFVRTAGHYTDGGAEKRKMKIYISILLSWNLLFGGFGGMAFPVNAQTSVIQEDGETANNIEPYGRSYRSPRRSYNPGFNAPNRTTPARPGNMTRDPRYQTPPRTTPTTPRWGGFFGGLALGTIIGSLFNPFAGINLGFPILSILSIVLWVIGIMMVLRFIRKVRGGGF